MVRGISEDGSALIFRVKQSKMTGLVTTTQHGLTFLKTLIHSNTVVRTSDLNCIVVVPCPSGAA
jgi:hypothetical protein